MPARSLDPAPRVRAARAHDPRRRAAPTRPCVGAARLALILLVVLAPPSARAREERILALAPHVCEILFAIGAGDDVVGAVHYSDHPAAAARLPRVGSYKNVSVEAALRLQPTLAVAFDRAVPGVAELERLGVRVEVSHPISVEGVLADALRLGRLTGREAAARALVASLRARLGALRAARPERPISVFYEVWHEPLITIGAPSFVSDALREIGARNVFAGLELESPRVGVEAVVRAAPEVVVIPDEKRDVAERVAFWERWLGAGAVRVVSAPHVLLGRPGPRLLGGMEQLQAALLDPAGASHPPGRDRHEHDTRGATGVAP